MFLLAVSDQLISGTAGVVGALIGGTVTGLVTLKAEDKRQLFARSMEDIKRSEEVEQEKTVFRVAARLLWVELDETRGRLRAGYESGWLSTERISTERWETHSETLAAHLVNSVQWYTLSHAYRMISVDREMLLAAAATKVELPARTQSIRDTLSAIDGAMKVLLKPAGLDSQALPADLENLPEPWDDPQEKLREQLDRRPRPSADAGA